MNDKSCNNIDVSVIVPMFHGSKYLRNILQMTKKNIESAADISIELVLVNDSPDDVPDFSVVVDSGYPVCVVRNEKNLGIQSARLRGAEHSQGEYLFFLDQDDEVSDDIIIRLYESLKGGEVAVSDWAQELTDGDGICSVERISDIGRFSLYRFCSGGNIIGPPGHCLIRRDCLPRCWTERIMKINGADDVLLWMGLLAEKRTFVHCGGKLYMHRQHPECYSNDTLTMLMSEEEAFQLAADEYGISGFWRWIHKRNVRYRKMNFTIRSQSGDSVIRRRMLLLIYPEVLLFYILDKMGIYV